MGGSIRDSIKAISPKWLQGTVGEKFLYAFGYSLDVLAEKMNQAMRMHIPTYGDASGLAQIGNDRLIFQGLNETPAAYAQRLKTAYDDWQLAGNSRSVLRQIIGYLGPATPRASVVANGLTALGTPWDTYLAGEDTRLPPEHRLVSPSNWKWDGGGWWENWIIVDCSSGFIAPEGNWDDGQLWDDGGTWDSTATVSQVAGLRNIAKLWRPGNVQTVNIILSFDATNFDRTLAFGSAKLPDGNWGRWHKYDAANTSLPSRFSSAAYLDGAV